VRYGARLPRCKYCGLIFLSLIACLFVGWEVVVGFYIVVFALIFLAALIWTIIKGLYTRKRKIVEPWTSPLMADGNILPFVKATREDRERVLRLQDYHCANPYCNVDLRGDIPHWDHIQPRSRGGTDSVHNMQWLCDTCNRNKRDMDWLEFLYRYARNMGIDPNVNQKPWKKWVMNRVGNGLGGYR
jgi:hypothetical protein